MLKQKTVKTRHLSTVKQADRILDKKTKRNYHKMFKQTNRRKQRLIEKRETQFMIDEYIHDESGI